MVKLTPEQQKLFDEIKARQDIQTEKILAEARLRGGGRGGGLSKPGTSRTAIRLAEARERERQRAEAAQKAKQLAEFQARQKAVQEAAQEKQRIFELGIKLRRQQAQRKTQNLIDKRTKDRLRVTTTINNRTKERIVETKNLRTGVVTTRTFERRKGVRGVQRTGGITISPLTNIKDTLSKKISNQQERFGLEKLLDKLNRNIETIRAIPFDKRGPKFQAQLLGSVGAKGIAETVNLFNEVRKDITKVVKDKKVRDKLLASIEKNLNPKKLIGKLQQPGAILAAGRKIKKGAVQTVKLVDTGIEFTKKHPTEAVVVIGTEISIAVVGGLAIKGLGKAARITKLDKLVTKGKGKLFLQEGGKLESVRIKGAVETKLPPKKIKILKNVVLADRSRKVDQFTKATVDVLERRSGRILDANARRSLEVVIRKQIIKRLKSRGIQVTRTQAITPLKEIPLKRRALAKLNRRIDKITQAFVKKKKKKKIKLTVIERRSLIPAIDSYSKRVANELARRTGRIVGQSELDRIQAEIKKRVLAQFKKRSIPTELVKQISVAKAKITTRALLQAQRVFKLPKIFKKDLAKVRLKKIKGRAKLSKKELKVFRKRRLKQFATVETKTIEPQIKTLTNKLSAEFERRLNIKRIRPLSFNESLKLRELIEKKIRNTLKTKKIPTSITKEIKVPRAKLTKRAFNKLKTFFKLPKVSKKDVRKIRIKRRAKLTKKELKAFRKRRVSEFKVLKNGKRFFDDDIKDFSDKLSRFVETKGNKILSFSDKIDLRKELNKLVKNKLSNKKVNFDGLKKILKRGKVRIQVKNIEIERIVNLKKIKPTKTKPLKVKDGKIQLRFDKPVKPKNGEILVTSNGKTQLILLKKPKVKLKLKRFKQIQIQRQAQKSKVAIRRVQRLVTVQVKKKIKVRGKLVPVLRLQSAVATTQQQLVKQAQAVDTIIKTITTTIQTTKQTSKQISILRKALRQAQKNKTILLKLQETIKKRKDLLTRLKKKKKRKGRPKAFKKDQGFNVLARPTKKRKGQKRSRLIRINQKPLNQKSAKDLRNFILDTSLSRSGRIKPTKGKPKKARIKVPSSFSSKTRNKFRNFRTVKGKRIPLVRGGVIEKKTKLLDTKQERANISLRKRIKQLTKRPTKKKPSPKKKPTPKKTTVSQVARRRQQLANLKKARRVKANLAKGRRRSSTAATSLTTRRRIISII